MRFGVTGLLAVVLFLFPYALSAHVLPYGIHPAELTPDNWMTLALHFFLLGMEHIWTGYDHILFLLSVVLLVRAPKRIFFLVTSFTLAHSITLILASFHIVTLSSRIVEPAIALTILFMAVRNLQALKKNSDATGTERISLTFAFGLIHGLGFATALGEASIPQFFFVPALLTFNVGIEVGQLCILALALPVLWLIDSTIYRTIVLRSFSQLVSAIAVLLLVIRLFFW